MHPNHLESIWPKIGEVRIPPAPFARPTDPVQWANSREKFLYEEGIKKGKTPNYGPNEISYHFNSYGYRCMDLDNLPEGVRVMSLGCSNTEGIGVPLEHTWSKILCDHLQTRFHTPVLNLNLGVSGSSNSSIGRLGMLAVPVLKPDILFVTWSYVPRFLYMSPSGQSFNWIPPHEDELHSRDPMTRLKLLYFQKFQNDMMDLNATMTAVAMVNAICAMHKVKLVHCFSHLNQNSRAWFKDRQHGVHAHQVNPGEARDFSHPGHNYNAWLAGELFKWFSENESEL